MSEVSSILREHDEGFTLSDLTEALDGLQGSDALDKGIELGKKCVHHFNPRETEAAARELVKRGVTKTDARNWARSIDRTRKQGRKDMARAEGKSTEEMTLSNAFAPVVAGEITETDHFAKDEGGRLYIYRGGVYEPGGEKHIERRIAEILWQRGRRDLWSTYRQREVIDYIRVTAARELRTKPYLNWVNLKNGIYDLDAGELHEHAPGYLYPVQLPVEYDPEADCPQTRRFWETSMPDDVTEAEVPAQLMAWLILDAPSVHKALLLIGRGENGKSRFLKAARAMLGTANTSSMSLHALENDRFAAAGLYGKLANICNELPGRHLQGTSRFKQAVARDEIRVQRKFGEPFDLEPYAKFLFSANHPPQTGDSSDGFFRRWMLIPFRQNFSEEERIPTEKLDAILSDPQEQSGVLNEALRWVHHVRENGITQTASMEEAHRDFRDVTDPLAVWMKEHVVEHSEARVPIDRLKRTYNRAARENGWHVVSENAEVGKKVRQLFSDVERKQLRDNGDRKYYYIGIGLHEDPGRLAVSPPPVPPGGQKDTEEAPVDVPDDISQ